MVSQHVSTLLCRLVSYWTFTYLHFHLIGAQQIEWYTEQETPRTDTAQAENLDQTDLANEEYPDDEPSGYTHTTAQGMAFPC